MFANQQTLTQIWFFSFVTDLIWAFPVSTKKTLCQDCKGYYQSSQSHNSSQNSTFEKQQRVVESVKRPLATSTDLLKKNQPLHTNYLQGNVFVLHKLWITFWLDFKCLVVFQHLFVDCKSPNDVLLTLYIIKAFSSFWDTLIPCLSYLVSALHLVAWMIMLGIWMVTQSHHRETCSW